MSESKDWVEELVKEPNRQGDDKLTDFKLVQFEESRSRYVDYKHAAHAMIYGYDKRSLWPDEYNVKKQAAILVNIYIFFFFMVRIRYFF